MSQLVTFEPGDFCWTDLGTLDLAVTKRFYGSLFDWSFVDVPPREPGEVGAYVMATLGGRNVCALYTQQPEDVTNSVSRWTTYVAVHSADVAVKKAAALGARVSGDKPH